MTAFDAPPPAAGGQSRPAAGANEEAGAGGAPLSLSEVHLALGQMYLDRGEHAAAVEWFRAAARAGDACGYNMLGRCFDRGWGVAGDPAAAARYYRKAANLGDVWALFNLADLHFTGRGVARDDAAAFTLYLAAARRGHVKSLNMLGLLHEDGRGVARDPRRAAEFFRAAAEGGDCWGAFNHARILLERGETDDAAEWIGRSLATGFADYFHTVAATFARHPHQRLAALAQKAGRLAGTARGREEQREARPRGDGAG